MDELLGDFVAETRDTMQALAGEIVAWEADPSDQSRLDAIFRFVHTVKGSCGFLDLHRLERLSHAAEDVLAAVRAGRRRPDPALVSAVLAVVDRIGEHADAIEAGEPLPGDDEALIAALAEATPAALPSAPVLPTAPSRSVARSIRLPVELLDRMMAGVSDMVLARNELSRKLQEDGAHVHSNAEAAFERLSACIAEMRDAITRTRMARVDGLFSALPRIVRDLSAELGKLVRLDIDGGDVELDREMIEMIRDPLTHVVRNAVDHGIETPEERIAAGKTAHGELRISARQSGNQILIDAIDDGRGINADRLVAKAIEAGLLTAEQAAGLSWSRKLDLIFSPGLSTANSVTAISGRGVGMDVVRANVERIGGSVEVDSRPGTGLRLTMRVPLTLTIIPALTASVAAHRFAIPRSAIEELVRIGSRSVEMQRLGGAQVARIRGQRLPVVDLRAFMGQPPRDAVAKLTRPVLIIVKAGGGARYALQVDQVHDHEDLVVKPAAPAVMATGIYGGITLPDNSLPMLLLDVAGIAAKAGVSHPADKVEEVVSEDQRRGIAMLLFRDLDGVARSLRLSLVDRIEEVPAEQIEMRGGVPRLLRGDLLLPVLSCGAELPAGRVRLLRLNDGYAQLAYPIDQVIDVVESAVDCLAPAVDGKVGAVAVIQGKTYETLAVHALFSRAADLLPAQPSSALCLIDETDAWSRSVLAPLVASVGYRVAFKGATVKPDMVLRFGAPDETAAAPVIGLRAEREGDPDRIYRYDKPALLNALHRHAGRGQRA